MSDVAKGVKFSVLMALNDDTFFIFHLRIPVDELQHRFEYILHTLDKERNKEHQEINFNIFQ